MLSPAKGSCPVQLRGIRQLQTAARSRAQPQLRVGALVRAEQPAQHTTPYPTAEELGDPFGPNPFLLARSTTAAPLARFNAMPSQQAQAPIRSAPAQMARPTSQSAALKQNLLQLLPGPGIFPPFSLSGAPHLRPPAPSNGAKAEQIQEAVVLLERENQTASPAQEALDGQWHAIFFSGASPGIVYTSAVSSLPNTTATSLTLDISCKSTLCVATAAFQTAYGQELKLFTRSRWTAEGPVRLRENYEQSGAIAPTMSAIDTQALAEAMYSTSGAPELLKENIPTFEPATAALISLIGRAAQPIFTWAGTQGSKVPVSGLYERMLYVSYLDSDTMVLRDIQGAPTVLRRGPAGVTATAAAVQEAPQALRDAPAQAPLPPVPQYSLPSSAEVHDRESPLALPTSGLYAGLDPAIVAALTGRPKPQQ